MKMKSKVMILGACAVIGGYLAFATNGKKPLNSVLDTTTTPIVKTAYTGTAGSTAAQPIDFEKAATAAVPSVVHIKTTTKFKQIKGSPDGQDSFGGGMGEEFFRHFF